MLFKTLTRSGWARRRLLLTTLSLFAVAIVLLVFLWWGAYLGVGSDVDLQTSTTAHGPNQPPELQVTKTVLGPWDLYAPLLPVFVPLLIVWITAGQRIQTDLRAHDDALQTYLDETTKLLGEIRDPGDPAQNGVAPTVVRTRTLTLLDRLNLTRLDRRGLSSDAIRKRHIVRFLYEAELVQGNPSVVSLGAADLSYADLKELELSKANLRGANLSNADLRGAVLSEANLGGADLTNADLRGAALSKANLPGADFYVAKVTKEQMAVANRPNDATMPDGKKYEKWLQSKEGRRYEDWLQSKESARVVAENT